MTDRREFLHSTAFVIGCALLAKHAASAAVATATAQWMVEWTIESQKTYADPFNEVDVDVIFNRGGKSWRVPAFWRGENRWTVRFAPPSPGEYTYYLESTDQANPHLNGHEGLVTLAPYTGTNALLRHGMLRVSANKRYFEHADSTPFYWLGDTWWPGLSTRLSWEGFKSLTADRKAKGFTVVQLVAGLKDGDEPSPDSLGFCNEGGCVWDTKFSAINPGYFDYADRRIEHLVTNEMVPAIVGAWSDSLEKLGIDKLKKHWRYVIARYGAYPVFWIVGGEVYDPPVPSGKAARQLAKQLVPAVYQAYIKQLGGWTEVARYIRATDPYHHPVTVHEVDPDDQPLQDESLTDFQLFQPAHFGWPSIAVEVARLDLHYARKDVTKPLVVGEVGYEHLAAEHLENFQRTAFWLGMLNGAAGHSYGADGVFESSTADKPFPYVKFASLTWEEGMNLPGSYQIGLGAKLLQNYPWWRFEPHPEWVAPRGTTLLEPRSGNAHAFHINLIGEWPLGVASESSSEWGKRNGNFRLPYAAGVPREIRFIYIPHVGVEDVMKATPPPTILKLEPLVRYHAFYWDPSSGVKIDLGAVERPAPGAVVQQDTFDKQNAAEWTYVQGRSIRRASRLSTNGDLLTLCNGTDQRNVVASVGALSSAHASLVLRYHDAANYVAAVYSAKDKAIYLLDRRDGANGARLGATPITAIGPYIRLSAEVRNGVANASLTDGVYTYTTPIVDVRNGGSGHAGLLHEGGSGAQEFDHFEVRRSPDIVTDDHLEKKLYDARGVYRGELNGGGWGDYAADKHLLLDSYRPEKFLNPQDWVLVLEKQKIE